MVVRVLRQIFVIYVAANMLACSIIFAPWALPRETISGLLGRWCETERGLKRAFARVGAFIVNAIYFWEPKHCAEVYRVEQKSRSILYP